MKQEINELCARCVKTCKCPDIGYIWCPKYKKGPKKEPALRGEQIDIFSVEVELHDQH